MLSTARFRTIKQLFVQVSSAYNTDSCFCQSGCRFVYGIMFVQIVLLKSISVNSFKLPVVGVHVSAIFLQVFLQLVLFTFQHVIAVLILRKTAVFHIIHVLFDGICNNLGNIGVLFNEFGCKGRKLTDEIRYN
jgi:hypothetical protein